VPYHAAGFAPPCGPERGRFGATEIDDSRPFLKEGRGQFRSRGRGV